MIRFLQRKKAIVTAVLLMLFLIFSSVINAQEKRDSLMAKTLPSILIEARGYQFLKDIEGINIFAGKKTNKVQLGEGSANLAQNLGRMAFAHIPGVNVWDMDGAGTQLNISTRGTDAHRSIEMNMRQNGYNTNSDMFGYPEDHYSAPMQGVREIQLVRGSASLQFGSQFGGMMNFVMKKGDSTKQFSLESEQTTGSYNFFNSYNAIGGTVGKVNYYAYYDNRHGDGWRPNAAFNYHAYYANVGYQFSKKGNISFQFSRMDYRQQIAGGLTDAQFQSNAQQSNRARNYFSPIINIPAVTFNYYFSPATQLQITSHGVFGERSSVQFINTANIADTINASIGSYNPRQVDRDFYNGFTTEARLLHRYEIGSVKSSLAGGFRYFTELTTRRQKGVGTIGSDFDLSLIKPYGIDLKFHTTNYAVFAENIVEVTSRFSITPGFRYEVINTLLDGVINNATFPVSYQSNRSFPLFGLGLQYQVNEFSQLYGNVSQAYRPFLYANITPATQVGMIDPNLRDSKGYDVELGYRGTFKNIVRFDVNGFYLYYGDRIGQLTLNGPTNTSYLFTTNIGNAVSKGIEAYINVSLWKLADNLNQNVDVRIFNSLGFTNARYVSGEMNYNGENKNLNGNSVEGVPDWINRTGLEFKFKGMFSTLQSSYVSKNFSDANNTNFNSTGATGVVPSYMILDWAFTWNFFRMYRLSSGVNNITNAQYFTRRINMYPGPGILPADGRTFYVSMGLKI